MISKFTSFLGDIKANVAMSVGILSVPMLAAGGIAADYTFHSNIRAALQDAADAGALASTTELSLTSTKPDDTHSIAKQYVISNLQSTNPTAAASKDLDIDVTISNANTQVTVDISYAWKPFFMHYVKETTTPVKVSSVGSLAGHESICVIALDEAADRALQMRFRGSSLIANDCAIYSNSKSPIGITTVRDTILQSSTTYSGGGFDGPPQTFRSEPVVDSPAIPDPLAGRAPPTVGSCDHVNFLHEEEGVTKTIYPGVYCGGIRTASTATLVLKPGTYIMKDGPLSISGNSTITGENVGFYFIGDTSTFLFNATVQVNITAPKSGPMAGILFFEDRNAPLNRDFEIRSHDAERFEGTVYLPRGRFVVDKASRVGQKSKWTAIIARRIEIRQGPEIFLNSDYAGSDIPVPEALNGGAGGTVRLVR